MRIRIIHMAALLVAITSAACNSSPRTSTNTTTDPLVSTSPRTINPPTAPPETIHADGVRRVTTVELEDLIAKGQVVVVDVRGEQSFNAGHIPGARWIQLENVLAQSGTLPRDKLIVTYCS